MLNIPNADRARERCNVSSNSIIYKKVYDYNTEKVEMEVNQAIKRKDREVIMFLINMYPALGLVMMKEAQLSEDEMEEIATKIYDELGLKGYYVELKRRDKDTYYLTIRW